MATKKAVKLSAKKGAVAKAVKAPAAKITSNGQYVMIVKTAEAKVNKALCSERGVETIPNGNAVEALPQGSLTYRKDGKLVPTAANFLKDGARREKMLTSGGAQTAIQMLFRTAEPLSIFTRSGLTAAVAASENKLADDPKVQKFFDAVATAVFELYPEARKAEVKATRVRGNKRELPVDENLAKFIA